MKKINTFKNDNESETNIRYILKSKTEKKAKNVNKCLSQSFRHNHYKIVFNCATNFVFIYIFLFSSNVII